MKTIVSITPIAVMSDSRTYKMATSFTCLEFNSIVVEGQKSEIQPKKLQFKLIDVKGGIIFSKADGAEYPPPFSGRSMLEKIKRWLICLSKPFLNQIRTFLSLPNASLYYLHSFYQFPSVFLKSKLLGVAYIYDAHDYYLAENPGVLKEWLETLCIKYAAAVVTVSDGVAGILEEKFGCIPTVIRNCHDSRLEEEPARNLRQYLGLSDQDFLIAVVGQAKKGMAVKEALDALANMPPHVHLAFVGKNTHNFSALVEQFHRPENVHLVPPVLPSQVVPFIRSADLAMVLYYPRTANYEYCLPNGFFQSISAGLPILYPELPEIGLIARNFKIGIPVDVKLPEDIKIGMLQLLNSAKKYKRDLIKASQDLSWEKEERILQDLVNKVIDNHKRVSWL